MSRYVRAGALAGLAGGVALAFFLRLVGEHSIEQAIALERAREGAHHEMFSRSVQTIGGMLGTGLYGIAIGVVLAVVLAKVRHHLGFVEDWRRAIALGGAGFVAVALVPALKYPANPPSVGNPDTINQRTMLYLSMLTISVCALWGAWRFARQLAQRGITDDRRLPLAAGLFVLIIGVAYAVLPGPPDAVHAPATLIWRFRIASLGGNALLWAVTGTTLGTLLHRANTRGTTHEPVAGR